VQLGERMARQDAGRNALVSAKCCAWQRIRWKKFATRMPGEGQDSSAAAFHETLLKMLQVLANGSRNAALSLGALWRRRRPPSDRPSGSTATVVAPAAGHVVDIDKWDFCAPGRLDREK